MEVLLALTIIVGFMGAMFGLYWRSLEVRKQTNAVLDKIAAQRLVLDRISNELQTAMVYPFLQFGLAGEAGTAEWITCRLPGPGAWMAADVMESPRVPESDIQIIGYRLREGEDEDGEMSILGLERTVQTVLAPEIVEEAEDEDSAAVQVQFLTPHVKLIRFEYYDGEYWESAWTSSELPVAVKITIGDKPHDSGQSLDDYTGETMQRIVYVPGKGAGRRQSRSRDDENDPDDFEESFESEFPDEEEGE
jgi:hypothetical protein